MAGENSDSYPRNLFIQIWNEKMCILTYKDCKIIARNTEFICFDGVLMLDGINVHSIHDKRQRITTNLKYIMTEECYSG